MREQIEQATEALRAAVALLQQGEISGVEAAKIVDALAACERVCQAGRMLAAKRVLQTRVWRAAGFRTPGQWMAAKTHTPLGQAITAVETAHRLSSFPATREALIAGKLSEAQAAEITAAAAADPETEAELLETAERESASTLRDRCRQVRANAAWDQDQIERLRRRRSLRHWTDREGAVRLDGRFAPDDGARLIAAVVARAARLTEEARRNGQREPVEAHEADALVGLVTSATTTKSVVHVHVDGEALERGVAKNGERCEIPGVGAIPVAAARRLAMDGVVKIVAGSDADIRSVAHIGRVIPARLRTALEARDVVCVVPGCDVRTGLEIDHVLPLSDGGATSLANLARLCRYHHAQKSHRGWRLGGGPGAWTWSRGDQLLGSGPARTRAP